jgi:hypothetical protein
MTLINPVRIASCLLAAACLAGCASKSQNTAAAPNSASTPQYGNQLTFAKPEDAVKKLAEAVKAKDAAVQLETLFGANAREVLTSGDPVADRNNREVIAAAIGEGWTLNSKDANTRELVIGNEKWPFPIPLVKDSRGWWFDTVAGKEEIRDRRIGRNELSTIDTLRAYCDAQGEYAQQGRDGGPAGVYAQQIKSDPGKHNGLYWPESNAKEPLSPLGEFVATASAEGYGANTKEGAAPYHGYFYRILKTQGPAAPGGAKDYVTNGRMSGGFAMVAFPADYGNSGIMTFLVGPDGVVYQTDLGDDTKSVAGGIASYDPSSKWQKVK